MLLQMQAVNPENEQERMFVSQSEVKDSSAIEFLSVSRSAWILQEIDSIPIGWLPKIVRENEPGFFKLTQEGLVIQ